MDQPPASGGGGGGPAPFLVKTYEMVDDSSTDEIVSWCPDKKNSFIVWNPPEFARLLLPTYFKHNNFSSFIRQLNTYGFRKIDPERWEFSNDEFVKDQKHLLKNIHRRKPIHSHSHPPGSAVDPERVAFEEEIERLLREKATLEANILTSKQQRSAARAGVEELTQRFDSMKTRQESLLASLEKAVQEPTFVERLARKLESVDISAYRKKRRLPAAEQWKPVAALAGNDILDDDSSARPDLGSMFDQDFSNKLRLELSPALSDVNLVSCSTQSSNEDGPCPLGKASERDPEDTEMRIECPLFAPEPLDVSDTGTSFVLKMDSYFPQKAPMDGDYGPQVLHRRFGSGEDADANVSCQLKLALASSPLRANRSPFSSSISQQAQQIENLREADSIANTTVSDPVSFTNNRDACEEATPKISKEPPMKNQEHTAKPVRVNDVFWEQFLTERPGSSDNEEACSSYRANAYEEQEERRTGNTLKKSYKRLEQLSL